MNDEIISLERQVWDALVRGDAAADKALLQSYFLGVYPDGFADRDAHAGQLSGGPTIASYTMHEITTKSLGSTHALISYRAEFLRINSTLTETMYVSSIWYKHGNRSGVGAPVFCNGTFNAFQSNAAYI